MADSSDMATAAAILACEASRQQLAMAPSSTAPRDVPGELLQLYKWYASKLDETPTKAGTAPRSW